jgi:hypothetical protein
MATDKNTLKSWFETGDIPTQEQFWALIDSFFHKEESIPITSIAQIENILNGKADKEAFDNHLTDQDAHPNLLTKARIIPVGQMLVFKVEGNENENEKEVGDFCMGLVEDEFINANYLGGDESLSSSYGDSND